MNHRTGIVFLALGAALGTLLPATAMAQAQTKEYTNARDIPIEQFFALPEFREMRISPDGKRLAAVAPAKGRGNLVVIDLTTRQAKGLTASDRWDVARIRWIGNNRIYFSVVDGEEVSGAPRYKGGYSINADGSDMRQVFGYNDVGSPTGLRVEEVLDTVGGDSTEAYVSMYERSRRWLDVYKLDFRSLRFELLTFDSPGRVVEWVLDSKNRPRMAVKQESRPAAGQPYKQTYWHRAAEGGPWQQLFEISSYQDGETIGLCGFDNDDRTLYVTARRGRDKSALWRYDTQTKQFGDLMVEDALVDISCGGSGDSPMATHLLGDVVTKKVAGVAYQSDRPKQIFFDRSTGAHKFAETLAASLPGMAQARWTKDRSKALISTYSDLDSGTYYLYDAGANKIELIAQQRPWAKPELMAERKFIQYKARDGMMIPAYVTLPRGAEAKNLPLIVNVHGGPWVKGYFWSEWGRWPEAQFFASRGYAVLEPEPRGSDGHGLKLFTSSFKQYGQTMQDDITDGALSLVQQGIVDRNRICLSGGSYGGYAALQGLVREPDLFKCGNAFVAVTDLALLQTVAYSDTNVLTDFADNEFTVWIGDRNRDADFFQRNSPARNADKIKAPVMLTMGTADVRVPLVHGEVMRDALRKAGKKVEWKAYADEGHGFNKNENVVDFYTRSLRFFDEHIGSKAKP